MSNRKALLTIAYPEVSSCLAKHLAGYKKCVSEFIEFRSKELYDTAPCDRIFFRQEDINSFFEKTTISEEKIETAMSKTYYASIAAFNPRAAKDPFTVAMMMVVRYFHLKNMHKELELAMLHLAFSGKFYPSIHSGSYPKTPPSQYRFVMDYVINNLLTKKHDLKSQGSVFGAIRSICQTWIKTYDSRLRRGNDDDMVYMIQQLHNRIKSFTINIATLYYDVYDDKDKYMTYNSDSLDDSDYHLSDSDALLSERIVEKSMERINTKDVDYKLCKSASDINVNTEEVKTILQTIISNPKNQSEIKELIGLLVSTYMAQSENKDINDIKFITFSIAPKPNSKDKNIVREREIVENWLEANSTAYRRRKTRLPTKNSYHRAIFTYFTMSIYNANK